MIRKIIALGLLTAPCLAIGLRAAQRRAAQRPAPREGDTPRPTEPCASGIGCDAAFQKLMDGNRRYVSGRLRHPG